MPGRVQPSSDLHRLDPRSRTRALRDVKTRMLKKGSLSIEREEGAKETEMTSFDKSCDSDDTIELPWKPPGEEYVENDLPYDAQDHRRERVYVSGLYGMPNVVFGDERIFHSPGQSVLDEEDFMEERGFPLPPFSSGQRTPDGIRFRTQRPDASPTSSARAQKLEELLDEIRQERHFDRRRETREKDVNLGINIRVELDPAFKAVSQGKKDKKAAREPHVEDDQNDASYWNDIGLGAFGALVGLASLALGVMTGMSVRRFR